MSDQSELRPHNVADEALHEEAGKSGEEPVKEKAKDSSEKDTALPATPSRVPIASANILLVRCISRPEADELGFICYALWRTVTLILQRM